MNDEVKPDETNIEEVQETEPVETSNEDTNIKKPTSATAHVKFKGNSDKIDIIIKATQEKSTIAAANKSLRLIQGRLYYVPVDIELDSDEYGNMKQYSQTSDKFVVRYIKDGFACIDPVQHNTQLIDGQQLCILW